MHPCYIVSWPWIALMLLRPNPWGLIFHPMNRCARYYHWLQTDNTITITTGWIIFTHTIVPLHYIDVLLHALLRSASHNGSSSDGDDFHHPLSKNLPAVQSNTSESGNGLRDVPAVQSNRSNGHPQNHQPSKQTEIGNGETVINISIFHHCWIFLLFVMIGSQDSAPAEPADNEDQVHGAQKATSKGRG